MRRLVGALFGLVALAVGLGLALDRWQPLTGSPDAVSQRFLAALPPASSPEWRRWGAP